MKRKIQLYMEVRRRAENKEEKRDIIKSLIHRYSKDEIEEAYKDYKNPVSTQKEKQIIKEIKQLYSDGYTLTEIADTLEKKHDQYTLGKALMQVDLQEDYTIKDIVNFWKVHTIIHTLTLIATLYLALTVTGFYIIPLLIILFVLLSDYSQLPNKKSNTNWDTQVNIVPGVGLWASQGPFGYASGFGTYIRLHVLKPELALTILFAVFMITTPLISTILNANVGPNFYIINTTIFALQLIAYSHRRFANQYA